MPYQPRTLRDQLGALYDLIAFHGSEEDFTPEQRNQIRRLYNEVKPYDKIAQRLEEDKIHASR